MLTIFQRPCPVTAPSPKSEPHETCVVDTGIPYRPYQGLQRRFTGVEVIIDNFEAGLLLKNWL